MIHFYTQDVPFPFPRKKAVIKTLVSNLIKDEGLKLGDLNFIFCDDTYILALNEQHLSHHYTTDVIGFDESVKSDTTTLIAGEIYISNDTVAQNAKQYGVTFENEMLRVIFHGVLHFCGYKDKTEAEQELMTAKENQYLQNYEL